MKREITPKDFIHDTLIVELGNVVSGHAFLSFSLVCSGIEFLGKCIDTSAKNWNQRGKSEKDFKKALKTLFPKRYTALADQLYTEMRCGMLHSYTPGSLLLSEIKNDGAATVTKATHLLKKSDGQTVVIVEYFYQDFVEACKIVIAQEFPKNDKMNRPLLEVREV